MIFVLLALGIFLLAAVGFTVDVSNLWFHRQAAQNAADAACTAGIMNVLVNAEGVPTPNSGFTVGTGFDCSSKPTASPCRYAAFNGYNGSGLVDGTPSNDVAISFPASVSNPPASLPPTSLAPHPYLRVDLVDRVKVFFMGLVTGSKTQDVRVTAVCGLALASVPIPAIVMNPTCPVTLSLGGSSRFTIVGGPNQSVQVNSSAPNTTTTSTAVNLGGSVNFSQGGPSYTGSNFGVFGGPPPTPGGYNGGTTGSWISPSAPIGDPFYNLPVPNVTAAPLPPPTDFSVTPIYTPISNGVGKGWRVPYRAWGCPDTSGCDEYTGGLYPNAIEIKNTTAIFDPGVYKITGTVSDSCPNMPSASCWKPSGGCRYGLAMESNSTVRPSTAPGDGTQGTMFYLSGTGPGSYGSVFVGSNSGSRAVDGFPRANAICAGGTASDFTKLGMPDPLNGNVLLGPCTGTYGSDDGLTRGMLFWNDRDNADLNGQASFQGGGQMLLAGTMYFHNCSSNDGAGLGTNCKSFPNGYNGFLQLQGNPGSSTYILGFIVTDDLSLGGSATLAMALDPNKKFNILKATLLQ